MSYSNRRRRNNDAEEAQSDDDQSERSGSPVRSNNNEDSDDDDTFSDHADEKDADLDEQLAALKEFEIPSLQRLPLCFNPPQIYSQSLDLATRDIVNTEKLITQQIEALMEVAYQAEEFNMSREVKKTEDTIKLLLDQIQVVQSYNRNFNKFKVALLQARGEAIDGSLVDALETATTEENEAYQSKSASAKYNQNATYLEFKQRLWEINHPEEAMPPLQGDESAEDDIVVTGQVESFKCPLTATWYVDPVSSRECKHTYSKAAITDMLRSSYGGLVDCPVTGCDKSVSIDILEPNNSIARRMERAKTLQKRNSLSARDRQFTVLE